ncbi:MAG: ImmA/IrrE family metallo-endopeptidase [Anaerolineales bacterium]|nr:ImmA/IrrE family metallo-endopeptidase [Anaerolineales bacterium]
MGTNLYHRIGLQIKRARERLGISQEELSKAIGYNSPASISHYESGQRKVSIEDLQKISDFLGLPISHFIDSNEPKPEIQKFQLRATGIRPAVQEDIEEFLEFASKHGRIPYKFSFSTHDLSPGEAASKVLELAEIINPPTNPLEIAEKINIPVFYWDFPDEVSGIYVPSENKSCIGINQNHPNVRQRFSLAHEIGHFVFPADEEIYLDFIDNDIYSHFYDNDRQKLETKANQFAADLLMPMNWVRNEFHKVGESGLSLLAQKFQVSEQAIWFRLLNLHLVSEF